MADWFWSILEMLPSRIGRPNHRTNLAYVFSMLVRGTEVYLGAYGKAGKLLKCSLVVN